ncbi:LPXTG cell wall anchor domain-containing protein [Desertimonas flava]
MPETGSPTLLIAALAGLLTASGATLLAIRGKSER